jgi:hypothetical protein
MRRFGFAVVLAAFGIVAYAATANAVPSFVRQTGLTCNQCHITFANVPDFTFTGKKFRLNGYRAPYVAEKIEAGEEGALNGKRLIMGIQNIFSLRFRNTLLSQSRGASSPTNTSPSASSLTTTPGSSISWFYVGAIGEHIGLWNEFYLDNAGQNATGRTFTWNSFDEYDIKFVMNPGYDNIIGVAYTTQGMNCVAGFCPYNPGGGTASLTGGGIGNGHTPYVNVMLYAMIKDRILAVLATQPGEDNLNFSGHNYGGLLAYAIGNSDYNQLWVKYEFRTGNDKIPAITGVGLDASRNITYSTNSMYTNLRGSTAATRVTYMPADMGDFFQQGLQVLYGFVDRGPHSFSSGCGYSMGLNERYAEGSEYKGAQSVGCGFRYYYDRTWGFEYSLSKTIKTAEFTDKNGVMHKLREGAFNPFGGTFFYRPAMNFSVSLGLNALQKGAQGGFTAPDVADNNFNYKRDGWSWNIQFDYMF